MTQEVRYGKYRIYYDPKPIPMPVHWSFVHDDYDGEGDNRHGVGSDIAHCKAQIDDIVADEEFELNPNPDHILTVFDGKE